MYERNKTKNIKGVATLDNAEEVTVIAETTNKKVGVVSRHVVCAESATVNGSSTDRLLQIKGKCNNQISDS